MRNELGSGGYARQSQPLATDPGASAPFYFEPFLKTDGSDLMRESVLNGMGIALLPTWMMEQPEKDGTVERLFGSNSGSPTSIFALSASAREINAKQRAYVEFLRAKFAKVKALSIRDS